MGPFAALERFFERLFERSSARLFHARIQPIQLQRRVERAMESGRLSAMDRVLVPNRYVVRLAPADLAAFGNLADSLELELADAALRFARAHQYAVADRPAVRLVGDPAMATGDVRVKASFSDGAVPAPRMPGSSPARSQRPDPDLPAGPPAGPEDIHAGANVGSADPDVVPGPDGARDAAASGPRATQPDVAPSAEPSAPAPSIRAAGRPRAAGASAAVSSSGAWRPAPPEARPVPIIRPATPPPPVPAPVPAPIDLTRTMIFEIPKEDVPRAILREIGPDGRQRELTFDGDALTIGRATDNFLVLRDARVSRHHGRLIARQGALVYSDLGSTNGSRVNGIEIDEVVLGAGDRIELGDTVLVVESVGAD